MLKAGGSRRRPEEKERKIKDSVSDTVKLALFGLATLVLGALSLALIVLGVLGFVGVVGSIVRGEA